MLTMIVGGIAALSIVLYLWGEIMRAHLPRIDLALGATASLPVAAHASAAAGFPPQDRFFTLPLVSFTYDGVPVYLTAPDALAAISSAVLIVRFLAWAVTGIRGKRNKGEE